MVQKKKVIKKKNGPVRHPYEQLQVDLARVITTTPPGEKLISEPALAKTLGVSRATLREAMRSFEGQGLIRRRQGKGTFVVSHTQIIESGLEVLESIESLAGKIQLEVSMGNLRIDRLESDEKREKETGFSQHSKLIQVTRVIIAEGRPVAYLIDTLPDAVISPEDLNEGFTGSVLDWLIKRGTPSLANSISDINAVAATPEIAKALQIQRNDVLLKFASRLRDTAGQVVDFSESYFLPGYFKFQVVRRVGSRTVIPTAFPGKEVGPQ